VHVGALSSILNGKRNVSRDLAERVTRRLLLDHKSDLKFWILPRKKKYKKVDTAIDDIEPRYLALTAQQFKIVAEWEHLQ